MVELLVLGGGFIGSRLAARHPGCVVTRRSPAAGEMRFDLADEATWPSLPVARRVVWTFPSAPVEDVTRFQRAVLSQVEQLVVLGSTSAYRVSGDGAVVDESSELDLTQPRVQGEEVLRAAGATVLSLAGLWGGERDPVRWLTTGRITDASRHVNLAHADDVVSTLESLLAVPRPGERICVSDGQPRRWSEHIAVLLADGRLPAGFRLDGVSGVASKRISNRRLRSVLPPGHRFRLFT